LRDDPHADRRGHQPLPYAVVQIAFHSATFLSPATKAVANIFRLVDQGWLAAQRSDFGCG
jgi:hypothetical protein